MVTHPGSTDHAACSSVERELARALALLQANHTGAISVDDLRDIGVGAPAQAVYDLQLAGHAIDRVTHITASGRPTAGYRLRHTARVPDQERAQTSPEETRDPGTTHHNQPTKERTSHGWSTNALGPVR